MGAIQSSVNGIIGSIGELASIQQRDKIIAEQSKKQTELQTQLTEQQKKANIEREKTEQLDRLAHSVDAANELERIEREKLRRDGVGEAHLLVDAVKSAKDEDFVRNAGYTPESFEKAMWANKNPEDVYSSIEELRNEFFREKYLQQYLSDTKAQGDLALTKIRNIYEGDK